MKPNRSFQEYLKKRLQSKTFREAYNEEGIFSAVAIQIAKAREQSHLSQKDLAKRLRTSQQMVSRLEDPHNKSCSLKTLIKLAKALNRELKIQLV